MEDVLEVYHRPYDERRPLVCLDEVSKQLVGEGIQPIPAEPGQPERYDYEYTRNGTANLFMISEPLTGWRAVRVTERRTAVDFAEVVRWLVEEVHEEAEKVVLVMDNLNTHKIASRRPLLSCRVQTVQLDPGIRRGELPLHPHSTLVPIVLPRLDLPAKLLGRLDPPVQALPRQHAQFDLGHVQPTAVLGRVVDLQPLDDVPRPPRLERLVKRRQLVRVEVVHHQHDLVRFGVHVLHQPAYRLGEVYGRPPLGNVDRTPARQRLRHHEQVRRPVVHVLVVEPLRLAPLGFDRLDRLADQLFAGLVQADHRLRLVVRPVVDFQYVLHRADELGVGFRRDAPLFLQPRLE